MNISKDEFINRLTYTIEAQKDIIKRLKSGDFTEEELLVIASNPRFQMLCHNLPAEVGICKFADGCDEEQRKLFGTCRTDELYNENLRNHRYAQEYLRLLENDPKEPTLLETLLTENEQLRKALKVLPEGSYLNEIHDSDVG